jgi:hypothetical protein
MQREHDGNCAIRINYKHLLELGRRAGSGRLALPVAGDDASSLASSQVSGRSTSNDVPAARTGKLQRARDAVRFPLRAG